MSRPGLLGRNLLIGPHAAKVWVARAESIIVGESRPVKFRPNLRLPREIKRARNKVRRRAIKMSRRIQAASG